MKYCVRARVLQFDKQTKTKYIGLRQKIIASLIMDLCLCIIVWMCGRGCFEGRIGRSGLVSLSFSHRLDQIWIVGIGCIGNIDCK